MLINLVYAENQQFQWIFGTISSSALYHSSVENIPHCVKSVQIRSFFWSVFSANAGKYGPEKTIWTIFTQWLCAKICRKLWKHLKMVSEFLDMGSNKRTDKFYERRKNFISFHNFPDQFPNSFKEPNAQ